MAIRISSSQGDILSTPADVLLLKYSNANRGADLAVAGALGGGPLEVGKGQHKFFSGSGRIRCTEVLVLGVGALEGFEYAEIEAFARDGLQIIARERPEARSIALTIHGPGYGLDELASIDSLTRGLTSGGEAFGARDVEVTIVEKWAPRQRRVENFPSAGRGKIGDPGGRFGPATATAIARDGTYAKRLFAAMPFKDAFLDHWDLALQPAAHEARLLIERMDYQQFAGEIIAEIRNRISKCAAVVALIDEANPNVFLEVGYAWGVGKPTILALHSDGEPPFDVRGHKILRYGRIGELKTVVAAELAGLSRQGLF